MRRSVASRCSTWSPRWWTRVSFSVFATATSCSSRFAPTPSRGVPTPVSSKASAIATSNICATWREIGHSTISSRPRPRSTAARAHVADLRAALEWGLTVDRVCGVGVGRRVGQRPRRREPVRRVQRVGATRARRSPGRIRRVVRARGVVDREPVDGWRLVARRGIDRASRPRGRSRRTRPASTAFRACATRAHGWCPRCSGSRSRT